MTTDEDIFSELQRTVTCYNAYWHETTELLHGLHYCNTLLTYFTDEFLL